MWYFSEWWRKIWIGRRVVFYPERGLIWQMSLEVTEIVAKVLTAFGISESRDEDSHKNVVIGLGALALLRTTHHTPMQYILLPWPLPLVLFQKQRQCGRKNKKKFSSYLMMWTRKNINPTAIMSLYYSNVLFLKGTEIGGKLSYAEMGIRQISHWCPRITSVPFLLQQMNCYCRQGYSLLAY